ncbi:succinate dehydrogenase cytochrome b small subunit [Parastagonospora nodorum]|nr:succinate dehydrogenase cytochrome b small subunit [Parastagonospora nodorum]QRD02894.1 succinate dehydrogenase cytochrome b small subunit [Parastagonospora nodorum SN15]KAH3937810.1 succinate dehydrogenase cytochrome b small subunit [Parastagonospora nodorum]KAH3949463.1 succinate dehydrogenase cytochrome b small subunit [Parastagonospora nodorum]KAH3995958.1 succinate dehydrogenase cytochrome b small subunit [Parastagonospora nodorum]
MRPSLLRHAVQLPAASQRSLSIVTSSSLNRPLAQQLRPAFQRSAMPTSTRIAAFHATQRNQILPPLPQKIEGTTNDPTPVPNPDYSHGSYHWSFERIISAGLVPLTLAPFAAGSLNPVTDSILCALLVVHSHIGFESCIIDYFPKKRIPKLRAAAHWALRISTLLLGVALYSFETNDVGITEAVSRVWHA